jgi:hypothetical protein
MSALQYYTLACDFGVGYQTLINHLHLGMKQIGDAKASALFSASPKLLRAEILGRDVENALVIGSPRRPGGWIDLEEDMLLALPRGTAAPSALLTPFCDTPNAEVFRAIAPGTAPIGFDEREILLRVMPKEYVGLARYRHLERE